MRLRILGFEPADPTVRILGFEPADPTEDTGVRAS